MGTIQIKTERSSYPVILEEGAIKKLPARIRELQPEVTSILYIIDKTVHTLHHDYIKEFYPEHKNIHVYIIPSGESAKSFKVYEDVLGFALKAGLDRHSLIVACGGGATGDLAGFVAASYMRGIRFIQVPTTILAHDSAVGGKVAINHSLGKNMVGSFHQPSAVIYDIHFLTSLPDEEIKSGFAEVIKHAIIADHDWLQELMETMPSFTSLTSQKLEIFLKKGIEVKAGIVEQDEKELGIRAFLNFGHTYGHAIEAWAGYSKWSHGASVMVGMIYALLLSSRLKNLSFETTSFINWIKELGYEIVPPEDAAFEDLLTLMRKDKKTIANEIRFVLLEEIGQPVVEKVSINDLVLTDKQIRRLKGEIE
ncbi:3-dehydroquinate synthase [Jeotgalibacillus proteolyticus]|uniref:3-dehydroquinate synthase n=1 Tax=Jeotgalibacillus proteolyticus TaxID=2082395 RepID=A0A2S5GEG5_9BACL|nr:3-dehydroquinate synthase [Jeotgalibacillus proteolyticus]PPA71263.1 3-dehydroquinate synthase [Jeotgalibacillus proteolyticus]